MLDEAAIDNQHELLAAHRRTLAAYLRRLALVGKAHAPPEVTNGIDEERTHIQRIKATLRDAGASVEDYPDDEPPALVARPSTPSTPAMQPNVSTGGGDYAGRDIDKQHRVDVGGSASIKGPVVGDNSGTINVSYYQGVEPPTDDAAMLRAAQALFAGLPLDTIPDVAPLPAHSRMPLSRNPLFVGRTEDLHALARIITTGNTAAIGQIAAATGLGGIGKTHPTYYPSYSTITV
jgi:hypothetical protein